VTRAGVDQQCRLVAPGQAQRQTDGGEGLTLAWSGAGHHNDAVSPGGIIGERALQ
jgi:hypothetical protein